MAKKDKKSKDNRAALDAPQTADIGWINQQEHPALGLTPARLNQLLRAAEAGDLTAQADLGADMEERDGHIFSELDKRKQAVKCLEWSVIPPKNASIEEIKLAAEVHEWVDDIEDFETVIFDAMDAIGHGYSCQTIEWQRVGSLILPASFEHSLARDFKTPLNKPNELRLNDYSVDGAEFWDYGWLAAIDQIKIAANSQQQPDPSKFVPVIVVTELQTKIAKLEGAAQTNDIETLIIAACGDGRLLGDGMKAWATNLGETNPQALKEFLDTAPKIPALSGKQTETIAANHQQQQQQHTPEALHVANLMGVTL